MYLARAIFNALLSFILVFVNVVLSPINSLITNNFPNLTILINRINQFINYDIGGYLAFFGNLIPPLTKALILFYMAYIPIRFIIVINIKAITWVFDIIKRIKIW